MKNKAENLFHGEEGYNCAQAIFAAFQETHNVSDETIKEHKKSGGGRAENNTCGALYAAQLLIDCDLKRDEVTEEFIKIAGSASCREIKQLGKLSCKSCVGEAADLLDNIDKH